MYSGLHGINDLIYFERLNVPKCGDNETRYAILTVQPHIAFRLRGVTLLNALSRVRDLSIIYTVFRTNRGARNNDWTPPGLFRVEPIQTFGPKAPSRRRGPLKPKSLFAAEMRPNIGRDVQNTRE